jgi:hypothetical protein
VTGEALTSGGPDSEVEPPDEMKTITNKNELAGPWPSWAAASVFSRFPPGPANIGTNENQQESDRQSLQKVKDAL